MSNTPTGTSTSSLNTNPGTGTIPQVTPTPSSSPTAVPSTQTPRPTLVAQIKRLKRRATASRSPPKSSETLGGVRVLSGAATARSEGVDVDSSPEEKIRQSSLKDDGLTE
ncbi:hypothetical protein VTL71DRAFT_8276 [Oculimacula yallundae]|uniref:Uncharacterized protein n=1 Tax=Oculimacula yallundae TaxID=86028 RepID=A0ABR4CYN6_9HELO